MLYKEDWIQARENFRAWWENELDRPIIQVRAPKHGVNDVPKFPYLHWGFARNPSDPEATIGKFEEFASRMYFGGEAYPNLWINLGPNIVAAYLGAEARFREDSQTVWVKPMDRQDLEDIRLDPDNLWWQITMNTASIASKSSEGKFIVGTTDMTGPVDIAAALRGSEKLAIDIFKYRDRVKELLQKILEIWHICYDELHAILEGENRGSSAHMNIWAPKKWYPIQSDWAGYWLSPKLWKELALPCIREQCIRLDYTIYHIDGARALRTLDHLLKIPELDGIEWSPGYGEPGSGSPSWFPIYKKALKKGKRVVLWTSPDKLVQKIKRLGSKGLLIKTSCKTEEEAKTLLRKVQP